MKGDSYKLLFCASDAGGARQLQPVIEEASKQEWSCHVLCSRVTEPIFTQSNITAETIHLMSVTEAKNFLQERGVQALITGTTGTIGNERYLIAAAKHVGIRSIAVLDEWYNYKLRFRDEDGALGKYLPDVICVQDTLSQKLAIKEGLPEERLRITGSPELAELTLRAYAFREHPPEPPLVFATSPNMPSILFLSQPLTMTYGKEPGTYGSLGTFLGYQEDIVREDLAEMLCAFDREVLVIERLHPAEQQKPPPKSTPNIHWYVDKGSLDLWPLLWHADVTIGMTTMAILQAAILGKHPISYQPGTSNPNLCTAVRLGLAKCHTSKESLAQKLPALLQKKNRKTHVIRELPCASPDAARRVLALACARI